MSSRVFEQPGPQRLGKQAPAAEQLQSCRSPVRTTSWTTLEASTSITPKLARLFRWGVGAVAVALGVAGCGGGGGADATPTVAAAPQPDQVAAFAQTQQALAARMEPPQPVALAAVPPGTASDSFANLLANGGFESGIAGWVNWGNASVLSGQASSGIAALSVGTAAGGAGQEVGGIVPGSTYRLKAQARVSAASEPVYVGVNFLDQSGAPVTQNAVLVTSAAYTTAQFDIVAPPNAVKALVYVWRNAGSTLAYVDDIAFGAAGGVAPGAASPGNRVANGGFESGLANWVNWGNAGTSTDAAAGSSAAQVGTGAGGFGQQVGGVVAGNSYRVSALVKVSTPGEIGYLGVMFTDDAGNGLLVQNVVFRSTTYSAVQADLTAPPNATKALVFVWKNAGAGFAYADEVTLAQLAPGSGTPSGPEVAVASPVGWPVFQLPWGGEVSGQVVGSHLLRRYSTAGLQVGAATTVNFPGGFGSATVLEGGGYAAAWIVSVGVPLGSSQQLFTQAYNAAAQPIGSPLSIAFSPVGDALGNPAAVPQLAPLAGGGYVVVWALQQSAPDAPNDRGVYTQRFDANGQPAGPVQQATTDGAGFLHIIGTTTGGYVVSWGKSAGTVGGARAYGADGAPLAPEQVAGGSWQTGAGPRGSMAPLAGGGAAIVWQVYQQPVFVQHITAAGVALPAQVASSLAAPGRAFVANAGLPDGGSLVAWYEAGGNVYARRYGADGMPLGPQTRINLTTAPTSGTEIMVLADGSFMIAWDVGTVRYARTFPADALTGP